MRSGVIAFFTGTKLPLVTLFGILWGTLHGHSQAFIHELTGASRQAISQWQLTFAEPCFKINLKMLEIAKPLFTSLQVDETAIGKRKYNRGHRVRKNGVIWVWGGVGLTPDKKSIILSAEYVPKRDTDSVAHMIGRMMHNGLEEIVSDKWGATLAAVKKYWPTLRHEKVNHSKEFVNSNGKHTNNIESHWKVLKEELKKRWSHLSHDTNKLDDKIQLGVFVINCRKMQMHPFVEYLPFLFTYQVPGQLVASHRYLDGSDSEDGLEMRPNQQHQQEQQQLYHRTVFADSEEDEVIDEEDAADTSAADPAPVAPLPAAVHPPVRRRRTLIRFTPLCLREPAALPPAAQPAKRVRKPRESKTARVERMNAAANEDARAANGGAPLPTEVEEGARQPKSRRVKK